MAAEDITRIQSGGVEKITIAWTANGSGAYSQVVNFAGFIMSAVTDPGAAPNAPTDNYDMTLNDENGIDLLGGLGANRDTATTEEIFPGAVMTDGTLQSLIPRARNGDATLAITNAGAAKRGILNLYIGRKRS